MRLEVMSNIKGFKDKLNMDNFDLENEPINWYMKFNIPLDPDTVSDKTMDVTDTDGYIMRTHIQYNPRTTSIMISPIDSYEQNRYYILTVSKRVCSQRGQHLKREMYIVFKIINNKVTDFQVLKNGVKLPKPRTRPKDYDENNMHFQRSQSYEDLIGKLSENKLPMALPKINIAIGIIGLIMSAIAVLLQDTTFMIISTSVMVIGLVIIISQLSNKKNRSSIVYNIAVSRYDKGRYVKAKSAFHKALSIDPQNTAAEHGLAKTNEQLL